MRIVIPTCFTALTVNIAAAVCLTIWGIELWRGRTKWPGWTLWLGLVLSLVALAILHSRMDQRLDFDSHIVAGKGFYGHHRLYIALSAAQWLASLALLALTMLQWKQAVRPQNAGDL
jgi:hypothetical protein